MGQLGAASIAAWGSQAVFPDLADQIDAKVDPGELGALGAQKLMTFHVGTWTFSRHFFGIYQTSAKIHCLSTMENFFGDQFVKKVLNVLSLSNDTLVPQVRFGELPLPFGAELNRSNRSFKRSMDIDGGWGWEMHFLDYNGLQMTNP